MRWQGWFVMLMCLPGCVTSAATSFSGIERSDCDVEAVFSPQDNIEARLVRAIDEAAQEIKVQAYLFTSSVLSDALIRAHRKGVDVRVLLDGRQIGRVEQSKAAALSAAGIPVWTETAFDNAHNKVILIDQSSQLPTVITGSFNFTWTAQHRNAENMLIVCGNRQLMQRYVANWERHRSGAVPFSEMVRP